MTDRPAPPKTLRIILAASLAVGLVLLWQAFRLDRWGIFGPGPGLFPQALAVLACAFALLMLLIPKMAQDPSTHVTHEDDDEGPMQPRERRAFYGYLLCLIAMVVATTWSGFIATAVAMTMVTTWWGERRPWYKALAFGLISGLIGVIGFGYYMQVELPQSELELWILRFFR